METEKKNAAVPETALVKAAKIIDNLKCGLCPMQEDNFTNCSRTWNEDVRSWQCWVSYLKEISVQYLAP